jgi:hypothetical protein
MSNYDMAYKSITEFPQYTGGDTTIDKIPIYDVSAGRMEYMPYGGQSIIAGGTLTITDAAHARLGAVVIGLADPAGSIVTLPQATGTGNVFRFRVLNIATSNSHIIKVSSAAETMQGFAIIADTDSSGAASMFMANNLTADTITLNRSTTGSVTVGEYIECEDIFSNRWHVRCYLAGTGVVATPFSATV